MEKNFKIGIEDDNRFAKTWDLFSKQHGFGTQECVSNILQLYTIQLHMDFPRF